MWVFQHAEMLFGGDREDLLLAGRVTRFKSAIYGQTVCVRKLVPESKHLKDGLVYGEQQ
jgi:hypothetical protein